eukprot:3853312-Heterocapsa_arctica.AAC.1
MFLEEYWRLSKSVECSLELPEDGAFVLRAWWDRVVTSIRRKRCVEKSSGHVAYLEALGFALPTTVGCES